MLTFGLLGSQVFLAACGGAKGATAQPTTAPPPAGPQPTAAPPPAAPPPLPEWTVRQSMAFVAGVVNTIDLNDTLPVGVARGGTFAVNSSSALLPAGVLLAPNGLLTVNASAPVGVTPGFVFAYTLP